MTPAARARLAAFVSHVGDPGTGVLATSTEDEPDDTTVYDLAALEPGGVTCTRHLTNAPECTCVACLVDGDREIRKAV